VWKNWGGGGGEIESRNQQGKRGGLQVWKMSLIHHFVMAPAFDSMHKRSIETYYPVVALQVHPLDALYPKPVRKS
jgi:hypothetical protein